MLGSTGLSKACEKEVLSALLSLWGHRCDLGVFSNTLCIITSTV